MRKLRLLCLLLLLLLPSLSANAQTSTNQIVFVTANPTVCSGNKQYNNTTSGDIFERLGTSGTTCTKILNASGSSGLPAGLTYSSPNFTIGSNIANQLVLNASTTGNRTGITATGSDTNVAVNFAPKGQAPLRFGNDTALLDSMDSDTYVAFGPPLITDAGNFKTHGIKGILATFGTPVLSDDLFAAYFQLSNNSTGDNSSIAVYGNYGLATNDGGALGDMWAMGALVTANGASSHTNLIGGLHVKKPTLTGGATADVSAGVWIDDQQVDEITHPYAFWYNGTGDDAGVYRINDLGITAYYNPTFAPYEAGAVDFERVVQQWNTNVAEIGTEAGGTGVQRDLRLLAPNVFVPGNLAPTGGLYFSAFASNNKGGIQAAGSSGITIVASDSAAETIMFASHKVVRDTVLGWAGQFDPTAASTVTLSRQADGVLQIGTTAANASGSLLAAGATLTTLPSDAATVDNSVCVTAITGVLTKGSGTLGICLGTSSERWKRDINPFGMGLSDIVRLQPKRFFYLQGYGDSGAKENVGFIAEEAATVFPNLVGRDGEGKPNTFDMMGLIPSLVNSIKELNAKVDAQAREIKRLKRQRKR